ncbi:phage/plasmid primase, P4 family [Formosa agariphila KMM 3901]|uniref:Phage/plasmid primase, P4 family n=1 Tax=Formosa agariphila (strain DSM 15362 / KCTC 12365 / LMG 23005 / KMM 3901 / M-2Alg 35-1) TaxID=1347342 RepID=T2KNI7_FORAG|nr:phage/plasmid primase, P4 family [Formosa agariphila]CDF80437.1 phage/plasmid primase, P4 family [Formosa agariphila KMM 3901]
METRKSNIGIDDILNETESILEAVKVDKEYLKQNQVLNILNEMLKYIEPVNFRKYCKMDNEKDKLQKKHFLVACIELLLKTVNDNGFSLCRKSEFIYLYNSEYWENVSDEVFKDFLGDVALEMGVDKFDAKHHLFKDELYKQFIADAGLKEIKPTSGTTLINLDNGTFEITPKKQFLRPFKKSDFLTYQLPFSYDKEATAPQFKRFLDEVLPEPELQNILAEYLGYIFVKNSVLKLEKVLLLFGTGANGKSVLFEVLMALLGTQNVANYSLQSLTAENGNSRAMLVNKLLNYASEINGKLESNIFKLLISGEPVEARLLYKNTQTISDYARFMFNCNELPKEVENTNAFFRRFIILPFRVTIPPNKQDKELSSRIIETELSGVFNWVLNGLTRLLQNKDFSQSNIVQNEVLQYQKESDSVMMFLEDENYQSSVDYDRSLKDVYSEYKTYCLDSGYRLCSNRTFSSRLRKNGFRVERKSYGNAVYIEKQLM